MPQLIEACVALRAAGTGPVYDAVSETLLRLLETNLLRDEVVLRIGERWTALGSSARDRLKDRLQFLTGAECPENTIDYLCGILSGTGFSRGRREGDYEGFFFDLVERNMAWAKPAGALRCACCGYHFRDADIGRSPARISAAGDLNAVLARDWLPERGENRDPWKPTHRVKNLSEVQEGKAEKREYFTGLTIDHLIPEESLGPSQLDNLALVCRFCNSGKQAHRRPLEGLSLFAAGGLSDYPAGRSLNMLGQSIVVAAIEYGGCRCSMCGKSSCEAELTVRPIEHGDSHKRVARGFAPWNLFVACYDCLPVA